MKKFDYDDYNIFKDYLGYQNTYNANINTMIMWNHFYDIYYELSDHYLILLYTYKDTRFFLMPFCKHIYYNEAFDKMLQISKEYHFPLKISFADHNFIDYIKSNYSNQFFYIRNEYNDEYIYDAYMHSSLKGKKMQKRRNHYNYFIHHYSDIEYKILDSDKDRDDIIGCINQWNNQKGHNSLSELKGIINLLDYGYNITITSIYINNKIEALAISSLLNDNTLQIHVEKANHNYRGIDPALFKYTIECYSDIKYINREDDIGIEGLRISKRQLHPADILERYSIIEKNIYLKKALDEDEEDIKKLWLDSFDDENTVTADYYFKYIYDKNHTYILKNNNQLVSVMQYNPITLNKNVIYMIVGVCTLKQYQRQGCFDMLYNYSYPFYQGQQVYLQAYNPDIYKKYGFEVSHIFKEYYIEKGSYNNEYYIQDINLKHMNRLYRLYTKQFAEFKDRTESDFYKLYLRCKAYNDHIVMVEEGYMIYHEYDDCYSISEVVYLNINVLEQLFSILNDKDIRCITDYSLSLNHPYKAVTAMMSNTYNGICLDHYINEIY